MNTEDWELLSKEQQEDVQKLRDIICDHLIAQTEAFYKAHPELRLNWSFSLNPLIRDRHPVTLEAL